MFKTIVSGFDGSETSERALRLTCDIAQKYGANIHIVHTPQPETVAFAMGAVGSYHTVTTMPPVDDVKVATQKVLTAAKEIAKAAGVEITQTHVKRGDPGDVIVAYANKCGADLIVTGRRGLGALGAIIQGSTSLRVNHLAKCATLSVV